MQALATVDGSGYKVMVCLFMFGGNDANNMVVPTDSTRYRQYQRARPNLALPQDQLLRVPVVGDHGLQPAMPGLQSLVNAGKTAIAAARSRTSVG